MVEKGGGRMITKKRFIVDLLDDDNNNETEQFIRKYGADEITGMTNGDVIKTMFKIDHINDYQELEVRLAISVGWKLQEIMRIDRFWWNASYRGGGKE